jgi:hypothetical protein
MTGMAIRSYRDDRVTGGDGEDVGARHGPRAQRLQQGLDGVDDAEPPERARVGARALLPGEVARVVQQNGRVAALAHIHGQTHDSSHDPICSCSRSIERLLWTDLPARSSRGSGAGAGRRPCGGPAARQPSRRR